MQEVYPRQHGHSLINSPTRATALLPLIISGAFTFVHIIAEKSYLVSGNASLDNMVSCKLTLPT
jgi:hypothetical protein